MPAEERIKKCEEYNEYNELKKIINGILYKNGDRIDIEEFLNGNIKVIGVEERKIENEYFDITKWDV